jgi:ferric-dicitrate binding protein FerR (iron transport regulator)
MLFARRFATALAVVLTASAPLVAQGSAVAPSNDQAATAAVAVQQPAPNAATPQTMSLAPVADNASVGVRALAPSTPAPVTPPRRDHANNSVMLMIVGGAVLIVGAVISGTSGTIIMIGGGAVGIIGLIRYLQ